MSPLIGPLHAVLVVLVVSGSVKLLQPAAASNAMVSARLIPVRWRRRRFALARLVGLVETVVGLFGLVVGAPVTLGAAAFLYAGFNLFLRRLGSVAAGADCGCLGSSSRPPGPFHRWTNAAAAALCLFGTAEALAGRDVGLARTNGLSLPAELTYWALVVTLSWLIMVGPSLLADLKPRTELSTEAML